MKSLFAVLILVPTLFFAGCGGGPGNPPPPQTYTISGTVANLATNNGGLVLQDNGGDNLPVSANGSFQFATAIHRGSSYQVTVQTQPSNPAQQCSVANGNGTATANVTDVKIECGHNEWAWMSGSQAINQIGTYGTLGTAATANTPGGRQQPAIWSDASGDLWLFGGYGKDSNGALLPMNDLWKFSAGEWTWVSGPTTGGQSGNYGTLGVATANSIPGARFEAVYWTDSSGNFWLFGGNGFDSVGNEASLNDLWKYSAGQWTWMGGSAVASHNGVYGTQGVAAADNVPGARNFAVAWVDSSDNAWLFGGLGYDGSSASVGMLSDLWKYSNGQWTWMAGPALKNQNGVYGTQRISAASNLPGGRYGAYSWIDASGNLWLFGGWALNGSGASSPINDLWKYSGGQWTWMGGAQVPNQLSVYGTQGVASASNTPGARQFGVSWSDSAGNGWIFGGNGADSPSSFGDLNDLWKYSNGEWTWVSGANVGNANSTFGTEGILYPGNTPGGRAFMSGGADSNGNLWLFGGWGVASGAQGNLNDLWMYMP